MMKRFHFNFSRPAAWLLVLLLSGGCTDTLELEWAASPDVIFINADIHTGVPPDGLINPTAVAVRNGEIVHVGTTAETQALAAQSTRIVDLEGAMMLPGLFDNPVDGLGGWADLRGARMGSRGALDSGPAGGDFP